MFYSVFDKDTGKYMEIGKNSSTKEQAIEDIFDWLLNDMETDDAKKTLNWPIQEKDNSPPILC